jgi:small membrane protein
MIPIQPIIVILLVAGVAVYFRRLRSRLWDRSIVLALLAAALFFVLHPDSANRLAAVMGVGRGADLFFYVAIPGLGFANLLLFSRIRELEQQTTVLIRELAILRAERADEAPTASIAEP